MRERRRIDAVLERHRTKPKPGGDPEGRPGRLSEDETIAAQVGGGGIGCRHRRRWPSGRGLLPLQALLRRLERDTTTITAYDDDTTAMTTSASADTVRRSTAVDVSSGQAGVEGRLAHALGLRRRDLRAIRGRPPVTRFVLRGRGRTGQGGIRRGAAHRTDVRLRGDQWNGQDVELQGERADAAPTRSRSWNHRSCAGSTPAASRSSRSPSPSTRRSFGCTTSGTPWVARWLTARWSPLTPRHLCAHIGTAAGPLPGTPVVLPYRTLASIVDITTGDAAQVLRILRDLDPENHPVDRLDEVRPRLDCAQAWVMTQMSVDQRTFVREEPGRASCWRRSAHRARRRWPCCSSGSTSTGRSTDLTTLVYAIPKLQAGLEMDAAPTPELKVAQRQFFALLYTLLVGRDTGPRLPTLLLAIGSPSPRAADGVSTPRFVENPHVPPLLRENDVVPDQPPSSSGARTSPHRELLASTPAVHAELAHSLLRRAARARER